MTSPIDNYEAEGQWLAVLAQLVVDINENAPGATRWLVVNTITFGTHKPDGVLSASVMQQADVFVLNRGNTADGVRVHVAKVMGTEQGELSAAVINKDAKWSEVPAYLRRIAA